jgi:hypothetical protein
LVAAKGRAELKGFTFMDFNFHIPDKDEETIMQRAVILSRNGTLRVERESLQGATANGDMNARLQSLDPH